MTIENHKYLPGSFVPDAEPATAMTKKDLECYQGAEGWGDSPPLIKRLTIAENGEETYVEMVAGAKSTQMIIWDTDGVHGKGYVLPNVAFPTTFSAELFLNSVPCSLAGLLKIGFVEAFEI